MQAMCWTELRGVLVLQHQITDLPYFVRLLLYRETACAKPAVHSGAATVTLFSFAMSKRPTDDLEPSAKRGKRGSDRQLTKDDRSDDEDGPVQLRHNVATPSRVCLKTFWFM